MMPQDTSGIDIPAIRAAALQGQGGAFLPPASATTAYAQGGRTGYYAGERVEQDMIQAFSNYKELGGKQDFRDWYSDIYLPEEIERQTRKPDAPDVIGPDPWAKGAPYGYAKPGELPGSIGIEYLGQAQGGRIGYKGGSRKGYGDYVQAMNALGLDPMPIGIYNSLSGIMTDQEMVNMGSPGKAQGGRIGAQEGGLMDLGGMEKDYRQEGGFVPIGGQERADDVPARLSKNEFVFTADAVRAAGGGDIDAGAEVMENVMNNLEQGGQVSEESQGLEGARNMFATAQRLEGVM
jgi:hypothetical protein